MALPLVPIQGLSHRTSLSSYPGFLLQWFQQHTHQPELPPWGLASPQPPKHSQATAAAAGDRAGSYLFSGKYLWSLAWPRGCKPSLSQAAVGAGAAAHTSSHTCRAGRELFWSYPPFLWAFQDTPPQPPFFPGDQ